MENDGVKPKKRARSKAPKTETEVAREDETLLEAERIKELRERLYSRGNASQATERHALPKNEVKHEIYETIEEPKPAPEAPERVVPPPPPLPVSTPAPIESAPAENAILYKEFMGSRSKRNSLRKKVIIGGLAFFGLTVLVSAILMYSGSNVISGENISLEVKGPIAVGGGQELPFQVSVANHNTIAIQSATLIIEYPRGTHSAEDNNKELIIERKQLETLEPGEMMNVELKARIFGEENEEQEIKVSIDYRVEGSNATFHKEAEPLKYKVSTSPVVMTFDSVKTISSGQEVELKLTVQSNSPSALEGLLIKTTYPDGFDFTESSPDTVSGEDTWKFETLEPGDTEVITIKGLMTGYEDEARMFTATAGVANAASENILASMLAKADTEIVIEQPFLDIKVAVNGSLTDTVVIDTEDVATVEIDYKNALNTAIYDGKVIVELSGNALNEFQVDAGSGFYDSSDNTITWDSVDEDSLKEILPGRTSHLAFTLDPDSSIGKTPEMKLKVTVEGQRVYEDRAPQKLVGTAARTIKVASVPTIDSSAYHKSGPFTNTGPTPPVAERVTQYTFTLRVETGTNDVTGAEVTAVLPQYVTWLDLVTDGDDISYTASTRTMKWTIGSMNSNSDEEASVQVSVRPSLSQVGTVPTILESQRFKATDRFTGTVVRAEHAALTTNLTDESDNNLHDGRVQDD